jgi:hypothetical protein
MTIEEKFKNDFWYIVNMFVNGQINLKETEERIHNHLINYVTKE